MSGPVNSTDGEAVEAGGATSTTAVVEVTKGRATEVGGIPVRRALPQRRRRSVGAWCFVDHFGAPGAASPGMQVGPHPHTGLQTVTWLVEGAVLHRDSLGSEQVIRPGQLNLMTAGAGVAHAEEPAAPGSAPLHGVQLWVALPDATRHGPAAFEHHAELPLVDLGRGVATVLVGELAGVRSPARTDTPLVGAELALPGPATVQLPLDAAHEHAMVVLEGEAEIEGEAARPGDLAYVGVGREGLDLSAGAPARLLLVGGEPLGEELVMWWNFVGRTRDEVAEAGRRWNDGDERFGVVASSLDRIPAPRPSWARG